MLHQLATAAPELAMATPMTWQMGATLAIIGAAIVLFAMERVPLEITAMGAVAALMLLFALWPLTDARGENLLSPQALLAGFANPVLFTIFALVVIGQGLYQTGAVAHPARAIVRLGRSRPRIAFAITLAIAGALSAVLNNTPVVVIFIPVVSAAAATLGHALGRVLMPLSFITILGGMTTLIGSSSNLIVAALVLAAGLPPIGFFDFLMPGAVMALVGGIYAIALLPRLIRPRRPSAAHERRGHGRQFIAEITLTPGHPWIGARAEAGLFPALAGMTVRMVRRRGRTILRPFDDLTLEEGDVVGIAATRKVLAEALVSREAIMPLLPGTASGRLKGGDEAQEASDEPEPRPGATHMTMAEAMVAPASRLLGHNVHQVDRMSAGALHVVAIQRRGRMARTPLAHIRLEPGDVLLLLGSEEALAALGRQSDLVLLEGSAEELPVAHHQRSAILIFALTIAVAASGLVPIVVAAVTGALAMILAGCLNVRQAARAVDLRIYFLIGAAFALAAALETTGGAKLLAGAAVSLVEGKGPVALLSMLFLLTALLTNLLSNQATAALMTPITISAAQAIGADPVPFLYGLIFALNCSFATPIAYQTNLLVLGPGNYRFGDFLLGGLPLIVLLWLTYTALAPIWFAL